jgi:hypothetical protein
MAERGGRQQERSQDGPSTPLRTSYATSGSDASRTYGRINQRFLVYFFVLLDFFAALAGATAARFIALAKRDFLRAALFG